MADDQGAPAGTPWLTDELRATLTQALQWIGTVPIGQQATASVNAVRAKLEAILENSAPSVAPVHVKGDPARQAAFDEGWHECRAVARTGQIPARMPLPAEGLFGLRRARAEGWNAYLAALGR